MIAFHYTGDPKWFYAPQLRVHETSGTGGVSITGARFTIPGFVTQQWTCSAGQHLNGGETRELFPEIYCDYPLTFDDSSGRDPGNPMVEIIFVDDSGQAGVLSAKLPVTPGSLPTTYSGGSGSWTCR